MVDDYKEFLPALKRVLLSLSFVGVLTATAVASRPGF